MNITLQSLTCTVPKENDKRFLHGRKRKCPINYRPKVIGELLREKVNKGNIKNVSESGPFGTVLVAMNKKNCKRARLQLKNMWLRNADNVAHSNGAKLAMN